MPRVPILEEGLVPVGAVTADHLDLPQSTGGALLETLVIASLNGPIQGMNMAPACMPEQKRSQRRTARLGDMDEDQRIRVGLAVDG